LLGYLGDSVTLTADVVAIFADMTTFAPKAEAAIKLSEGDAFRLAGIHSMVDPVYTGLNNLYWAIEAEIGRLTNSPPAAYGNAWIQCFILTLSGDASLSDDGLDEINTLDDVPYNEPTDASDLLIYGNDADPKGLNDYVNPIQAAVDRFGAVSNDMGGLQSYGATMLQQANAQNPADFDAADEEYNNLNSAFNDDMQTLASLVISAKNNAQNASDLIHDATIDGDLNGGDDEEPINDSFR